MLSSYKIRFVPSARNDLVRMKRYILSEFKYTQYGISFDKKIKDASKRIKVLPMGYGKTGFTYRGLEIYMRCIHSYIFFYVVDENLISILRVLKEKMNWEYIISRWLMCDDMCV